MGPRHLTEILAEKGVFTPAEALVFIERLSSELGSWDQVRNLLLCPEFITVSEGGAVSVDLTRAELKGASSDETSPRAAPYLAPEQILSNVSTERTQVYALGAVAYYLLTAQPPFNAERFSDVVTLVLNNDPPALTALNARLSLTLEAVLIKALRKEPRDRHASRNDFLLAFRSVVGSAAPQRAPDLAVAKRSTDLLSLEGQGDFDRMTGVQKEQHTSHAARSAGEVFDHVHGSLTDIISKREQDASRGFRLILTLIACACIIVGVLGVWLALGLPTSFDALRRGIGQNAGELAVLRLPSGRELEQIPHQIPASGRPVQEMTDAEILGVLITQRVSADTVLEALVEAQRRKIPDFLEAATALFGHDQYRVRTEALKVIGESRDKRFVPIVLNTLEDHDPLVRMESARALASLGDSKVVSYLQQRLLRENIPEVKLTMRRSIERLTGVPMSEGTPSS